MIYEPRYETKGLATSAFKNNGFDGIDLSIHNAGTFNTVSAVYLPNLGAPYRWTRAKIINEKFIISAGVRILFTEECFIQMGNKGSLVVNGTPEMPVHFAPLVPEAGWQGIFILTRFDVISGVHPSDGPNVSAPTPSESVLSNLVISGVTRSSLAENHAAISVGIREMSLDNANIAPELNAGRLVMENVSFEGLSPNIRLVDVGPTGELTIKGTVKSDSSPRVFMRAPLAMKSKAIEWTNLFKVGSESVTLELYNSEDVIEKNTL